VIEVFEHAQLVDFFTENRCKPEDLYESERRFLPELARGAESVLDVGCAAAGFADIWRAFNPGVRYTGADVSVALVEAARRLHPDSEFLVADAAAGIPLPDRSADVVQALGWLHWERRYALALRELWRLTAHALFFDVRLHEGAEDVVGAQAIAGGGTTPYICASWPRFADLALSLQPARVRAYGYYGPPAESVSGMPEQVCFATFVLERGDGPRTLDLELPLPNPHDQGVRE
jgi:SAM-dependent methyltransferase